MAKLPKELSELADQVGDFMQYWGFKRVHGRIWTHLYLSPTPLDAGALIQRLGISKALASLTLNDLLQYEVIITAGKSEHGTQLFVANPQVISVITNVLRTREKKMLAQTNTAAKLLSELPQPQIKDFVDSTHLKKLRGMIDQAQITLEHMLTLSELDMGQWQSFDEPDKGS